MDRWLKMTSVRAAKSKGSQFEMTVHHSLKQIWDDVLLTKQQGFQMQFDIVSHKHKIAIECKRHASFSWNDLEKTFKKLCSVTPEGYLPFLVFQGNRQPCLVMSRDGGWLNVQTLESWGVVLTKHPSSRAKKEVVA